MKRKGLWLSVLATAMIAGSASATSFTGVGGFHFFDYNGVLNTSDWNYGNVTNVGTGVQSYNLHYQQVPGDTPYSGTIPANREMDDYWTRGENPGYPAHATTDQRYDVEQLFWAYDGNASGGDLHIGIVTGFNSNGLGSGAPAINGYHGAGDLFLAFGPPSPNSGEASEHQYSIAIGTSTRLGDSRIGQHWVDVEPGSPLNGTDPGSLPFSTEADPYRASGGSHNEFGANFSQVQWTRDVIGPLEHNFLTVRLALNSAQHGSWIDNVLHDPDFARHFTMHWTMGCGNDVAHYTDSYVPTNTPVVPVPAAAPLGLLGMGLLALVRRVRRRPAC